MTGKTKELIMYLLKQDDNTLFDINLHKENEKRSLNANGLLWKIADEIAKEISKDGTIVTKETIYKDAVKNVGVFTPIIIEEKAFKSFKKEWESKGLGAQISEVLHKDKCVKCNCYYGSSTYDTKEFSRLVDFIVQEAQQLGIETRPAEEIKSLYEMEGKNEVNNTK